MLGRALPHASTHASTHTNTSTHTHTRKVLLLAQMPQLGLGNFFRWPRVRHLECRGKGELALEVLREVAVHGAAARRRGDLDGDLLEQIVVGHGGLAVAGRQLPGRRQRGRRMRSRTGRTCCATDTRRLTRTGRHVVGPAHEQQAQCTFGANRQSRGIPVNNIAPCQAHCPIPAHAHLHATKIHTIHAIITITISTISAHKPSQNPVVHGKSRLPPAQ